MYRRFLFLNHPAPNQLYSLSLHDALPISRHARAACLCRGRVDRKHPAGEAGLRVDKSAGEADLRSEEHTSELQSRFDLVCRLLLEKKKNSRSAASATSS